MEIAAEWVAELSLTKTEWVPGPFPLSERAGLPPAFAPFPIR